MSFIWPVAFVFLALIPVCAALYLRLQARRRRMVATYGSLGFTQQAGGKDIGALRHIPPALFLIGLTILIVALARP